MTTCIAAESAATRLNGVDCLGIAVDRFGDEHIKRIEDIIVQPGFSDIKVNTIEIRRALTHIGAS